jgi:hypothetical protein
VNDGDVSETSHDNGADGFAIGVIVIFLDSNNFDLAVESLLVLHGADSPIDPSRNVVTFNYLVQIYGS